MQSLTQLEIQAQQCLGRVYCKVKAKQCVGKDSTADEILMKKLFIARAWLRADLTDDEVCVIKCFINENCNC